MHILCIKFWQKLMFLAFVINLINAESFAHDSNALATKIYNILNTYRLDYDIDACVGGEKCPIKLDNPEGKEAFILRLQKIIEHGKVIEFFLPSFPFKSPNTTSRCLGVLPDMAERKALEYLAKIFDSIAKIYPRGVRLTLLIDGQLFCDPLGISDADVELYESALKKISADLPLISVMTLSEMTKTISPHQARKALDAKFPVSDQEVESLIKGDPAYYKSELGKNRDDLPQALPSALQEATKVIIKRNIQLRAFVKDYLASKDCIRLSVHYTKDISAKFGIKLSKDSKTTPWFGTAVLMKDERWVFMPKAEAETLHAFIKVKIINGIPCLYYE